MSRSDHPERSGIAGAGTSRDSAPAPDAVSSSPAATVQGALDRVRRSRPRHTRVSHLNHMPVPWHEVLEGHDVLAPAATIADKSSLICRLGLLKLSGGSGAWRVREAMNAAAEVLGVTCSADVSLTSIECTCFDGAESFSEVTSLTSTGVNTERIWDTEQLVSRLRREGADLTVGEWHRLMDEVEHRRGNYAPWQVALASAAACCAFVFLLGGGPIEMGCAFVGAGLGMLTRRLMVDRNLTHFACIGAGVTVACLAYLLSLWLLSFAVPGALDHDAGYIGAMLFVIPGFPLITSGLDLAKLDIRSGVERLVYACTVIIVATLVAWLVASMVQLRPDDFAPLAIPPVLLVTLRAAASFVGVYGFSVLFNSPARMAATAGIVGAVANTLRLTLVDGVVAGGAMPPEAAAFVGALVAGLLASAACKKTGFPRISITVPSIVIMVPGLYLYRAVYYMGTFETIDALNWIVRAVMIMLFLPIGLALARMITDREWRHCS